MAENSLVVVNKELVRLNLLISVGILFMVVFLSYRYPYTLLLLLFTPLILGVHQGLEFDPVSKRYRKYKGFFFLKRGEWKQVRTSYSLVILKKTGTKKSTGTLMTGEYATGKEYFYELYLMDGNHRNRVFIVNSKKFNKVQNLGEGIGKKMNIRLENYNPK